MKKSKLYFLLVVIFLSFSNCHKDNPVQPDNPYGLPNATQTGEMVFACRIDGQSFKARESSATMGATIIFDTVGIMGTVGGTNYFKEVSFAFWGNIVINQPYSLFDTTHAIFSYTTDSTCISNNVTKVNKAYGSVTFTRLDPVNKIVSGIFSFKVPVIDCDTLYFTDGRFDIGY